jgi:hypothetical protein
MSIRSKVVRAPQVDGTRHGKTRSIGDIAGHPEPLALSFRGTAAMAARLRWRCLATRA